MTPEAKACTGKRKSAAQSFRHGRVGSGAVAAPVGRKLLAACGGRTGKQNRLSDPSFTLQKLKDTPVIKESIIIMHFYRIRAVKIYDIFHRNSFAKICFKAVHTHI